MARRKTGFDWIKLDAMLQIGATNVMAASILDCSPDYIEKQIKAKYKMEFKAYRNSKLSVTKVKLQQKAIMMAMGGHTVMLIFCLKNLCDWSDKLKTENEHLISPIESQDDETLEARLKVLEEKRNKIKQIK